MRKLDLPLIAALALVACGTSPPTSTSAPKKQPTPEQRAEIEKARADMVAAECALYAEAKTRQPDFKMPAQCQS